MLRSATLPAPISGQQTSNTGLFYFETTPDKVHWQWTLKQIVLILIEWSSHRKNGVQKSWHWYRATNLLQFTPRCSKLIIAGSSHQTTRFEFVTEGKEGLNGR